MTGVMSSLPLEVPHPEVRRALVLSGGGARGAYEAGVLRYVFCELSGQLGHLPRFDIYSGTSVGAVHAAHAAAWAADPAAGAEALVGIWNRMAFDRVYRFQPSDAWNFASTLWEFVRGQSEVPDPEDRRLHGLLNTAPLEELVVRQIPWRRLRRNVRSGLVGALCVSATEIATGRTIVFVDNRQREVPSWTHDRMLVAQSARIGPEHTLASAAIPFLFPGVRIRETFYCDGSLRQQTPLSPALRLGSNRVLVIGLRHEHQPRLDEPVAEERLEQYHSAGFLFGKVLNALLIDRLEYDLGHMRVMNGVLRAAQEAYGDEHLDQINARVVKHRGLGFRIVDDCFVRPSEDLGAIAARHVTRLRQGPRRSWIGSLAFRTLTRGGPSEEADLMSYLMFDGGYARDLIDLGYADARAMESELLEFFTDA